MINRISFVAVFVFALAAIPAQAQSSELRGTWSGSWIPEGGIRDAMTVRFERIDDHLSGEIINPENLELADLSFNSDTGEVMAEAVSQEVGPVKIEARIEDETRLNGTFTYGGTVAEMRLTKWTYVPRIR